MVLTEMQIVSALSLLGRFDWLVSYIAPFFGGENAVLFMAFLSAQGILPISIVIVFSFLAMITLDSIWFFIVKTKGFNKLKNWQKISKQTIALEKRIERISSKQDIFILLISKILIGTRILIIVYLSMKKMSYRRFFAFNFLPTLLWAGILSLVGWLAGKGYYSLSSASHNLFIAGIVLLGVMVILSLISYLLKKWLLKK